ncbi:MAG: hypothetical protein KDA59_12125, partial [Planctomycetales bacterium]|nr:hypothetical protein [Planctomycetales bacterium]
SPQEMQQRHVQQIQEQMLAPAGLSANKGPRALNLNPHANTVRPIQQSSSLPPIQSTTGPTPAADSPNSAAAPAAAPATTRAVKPQSSSGGTGLSRFFSTK